MRIRQIIFGELEYESDEPLEVLQDDLDEKLRSNTDKLGGIVQIVDTGSIKIEQVKQMLKGLICR